MAVVHQRVINWLPNEKRAILKLWSFFDEVHMLNIVDNIAFRRKSLPDNSVESSVESFVKSLLGVL